VAREKLTAGINTVSKRQIVIVAGFELGFWLLSIVIAFWFGLGWLFLIGTVRRLFVAIPWLYLPTITILMGESRSEAERARILRGGSNMRWHYILQAAITLGWLTMTILAFTYANVRLVDVISRPR